MLAFPLLVLGLSGFETGVSMMPLVAADGADRGGTAGEPDREHPQAAHRRRADHVRLPGRHQLHHHRAHPADGVQPGGEANGRALAYLAHELLGEGFGTVYDISSILILWFAGASAMAGLINIVPRYLPGYGMAPEWGRAVRPVVLVYTAVSIAHHHRVQRRRQRPGRRLRHRHPGHDGVRRRSRSRSAPRRRRQRAAAVGFTVLTLILLYALVENVIEKPDGIAISAVFIAGIIVISLVSRLAAGHRTARRRHRLRRDRRGSFITGCAGRGELHVIANKRQAGDLAEYRDKEPEQRTLNPIPGSCPIVLSSRST